MYLKGLAAQNTPKHRIQSINIQHFVDAPTLKGSFLRQSTSQFSGALSGLTGLDPNVSTGLVVLSILGLGALGLSRVLKNRKRR